MWLNKLFVTCCAVVGTLLPSAAQSFVGEGTLYPLTQNNGKCIVEGFVQIEGQTDEIIYANTLLWVIEHICPKHMEGIIDNSVAEKSFSCNLTLSPSDSSEGDRLYYCRAFFKVGNEKLIYRLSDIRVESTILVVKKVTPLEKLNPGKKESHRRITDEFVSLESLLLNRLFDFIGNNASVKVTHWKEIAERQAVVGMTQDECRLAFGKPLAVMENNGEVQWKYNTTFYLYFKDGVLSSIIR